MKKNENQFNPLGHFPEWMFELIQETTKEMGEKEKRGKEMCLCGDELSTFLPGGMTIYSKKASPKKEESKSRGGCGRCRTCAIARMAI